MMSTTWAEWLRKTIVLCPQTQNKDSGLWVQLIRIIPNYLEESSSAMTTSDTSLLSRSMMNLGYQIQTASLAHLHSQWMVLNLKEIWTPFTIESNWPDLAMTMYRLYKARTFLDLLKAKILKHFNPFHEIQQQHQPRNSTWSQIRHCIQTANCSNGISGR